MKSDAIISALKQFGAVIEKWLTPILAYIAGRMSAESEAKKKELKDALDKEREIARKLDDADERERVRNDYAFPGKDPD